MIYEIKQAIKKTLDELYGLNTYNYFDNKIDISSTRNLKTKNDILAGDTNGIIFTKWGEDVLTDLVGRYIKYNTKTVQITSQNEITGEVTISEALSSNLIELGTSMDILILDSCYIESGSNYSVGGRHASAIKRNRIRLKLKTKEDSNSNRISNYTDILVGINDLTKGKININGSIFIAIVGDITIIDITDKDNDLKEYLVSFMIEYRTKLITI